MKNIVLKTWSDENGVRWRMTDADPYPYISGTSIISIAKSHRYRAYKKDDKSKQNLQKAADLGTKVHEVLELNDRGTLPQADAARYQRLLTNYTELCKLIEKTEGPIEILELEKEIINTEYKYSGRMDKLVKVGNLIEVWDYKTSRNIKEEDGWQLAGYLLALRMCYGIQVDRVRIIHIDKITWKVTDLVYQHIDYMIQKFLHCLEIFKGMYFNDLLKGRINDIETFEKYKWPLEELTRDYLIDYITKKENNMPLPEMKMPTIAGKNRKFLNTKDGESVSGLLVGSPVVYYTHRINNKEVTCTGKNVCEYCKMGNKASFKFMWNIVVVDDKDKVTAKVLQKGWKVYQRLLDIMKKENLQTTPIKIERTGEKLETTYTITTTTIKHKAFQDVATITDGLELNDLNELVNPTFNQEDKVAPEFAQED